jgi:hypothetical protein
VPLTEHLSFRMTRRQAFKERSESCARTPLLRKKRNSCRSRRFQAGHR